MAVICLTRALTSEIGESGITVNCVCPGLVRTATTATGPQAAWFDAIAQQQAIKRVSEPEDVAPLSPSSPRPRPA